MKDLELILYCFVKENLEDHVVSLHMSSREH